MRYYTIMLDGPNVQEAVLHTESNRLGEIALWAKQYQDGQISVHPIQDITRKRPLPMAYLDGNPETTLDEFFGKQPTG